jgi:MFS family permease
VYGALLLGASASVALVAAIAADLAGWRANAKLWPALAGAAALLGLAASVAGFDGLVRKSLALGASVAFPTLALYLGFPAPSRGAALSVPRAAAFAVGRLWAVSVGSLLGGLLIGALLAEWRFMLAFDQFPGVKVAAVAPVLAFAALWILRWERSLPAGERRGLIARLWASLERPLSWRHAVVALSISVIALLLLVRSGNTSLPLVGIEERLRHFVEDAFVARPRTKEYLFGHPLLLIALAAAAIRLPNLAFPLALVGSVGQTGLVNSFCHLHTPLVYALWRTANALVLGTSVGIAGVAISAAVWGRWGGWARRTAARAGAR